MLSSNEPGSWRVDRAHVTRAEGYPLWPRFSTMVSINVREPDRHRPTLGFGAVFSKSICHMQDAASMPRTRAVPCPRGERRQSPGLSLSSSPSQTVLQRLLLCRLHSPESVSRRFVEPVMAHQFVSGSTRNQGCRSLQRNLILAQPYGSHWRARRYSGQRAQASPALSTTRRVPSARADQKRCIPRMGIVSTCPTFSPLQSAGSS